MLDQKKKKKTKDRQSFWTHATFWMSCPSIRTVELLIDQNSSSSTGVPAGPLSLFLSIELLRR